MPSVKECKLLTLVFESTGGATIEWSSDMPGGVMTVRKTDTTKIKTTNSKRETLRLPLDGIVGQLFQLKVTPDTGTQLKLFEGTLDFKVIGTFRDGACSEFFETEELSLE